MTINVDDDIIIHVFCPSKLCSCACCCECFKRKTKVVRYVTKNTNCWVDLVQQSIHIILFFFHKIWTPFNLRYHNKMGCFSYR
jgi:hypothetical protein